MKKHVTLTLFSFVIFGVVLFVVIYFIHENQKPSYNTQLSAIEAFCTSSTLRDFTGTYNVKGPEDVGYKLRDKDGYVVLIFGNVELALGCIEDMPEQDIMRFHRIGIDFYWDKDGELFITYHDTPVDRYAY